MISKKRLKEIRRAFKFSPQLIESELLRHIDAQSEAIRVMREALSEAHALNVNVFSDAEPDMLEYYSEHKKVISQSEAALSQVAQSLRKVGLAE